MNLKDKNLSLQLFNYLCDIIGSEDVIKTRRDIFTVIDFAKKIDAHSTSISSGSKAEGIDLKGSDYDQMFNLNFFRVYENVNDIQFPQGKVILIMDTHDSKPGFTKLKLAHKAYLHIDILLDWCEMAGEKTYISSKRFRDYNLIDDMIIHGPCQSSPDGTYDCAVCFQCKEWITSAHPWFRRSRTAWPEYNLLSSLIQYGVLFVPVGCKNSPNEDLQWRISFSVTEKLLIHSFTHTQLLCYALLKIILKDIIKPKHGDLLCSYFIKTIMLWLSEETSSSKWKPENMISCFLDCLRRLIYCVEYKTCLHYFIPENNLFEDRFTYKEHKALLSTLQFIYGSPWKTAFYTSTFQNYRLESVNSDMIVLSASALSCFAFMSSLHKSHSSYSIFKRLIKGYNYNFKKEMCALMLCVLSKESIQSSDFLFLTDKNKSVYKEFKRTLFYFNLGLQSDSGLSWLQLASLFYEFKQFRKCFEIINYYSSNFTPYKIYLSYDNSLAEQTLFKKMKQRFGLLLAWKYLITEDISNFFITK